jgi:hypothetical protein
MSTRGKIGWVLFCLAVCVSAVLLPRLGQIRLAQAKPSELYDVVCRQVNAMRQENFPGAYDQVSGRFQRRVNLPQFAGMARSDYADISHSVRIELGPVQRYGQCAKVRVYFVGRHGQVTPCVYILVNEGEAWKIDSVRVFPSWSEESQIAGTRI